MANPPRTPGPDLTTPKAGAKALRVFFRIAHAWGLTESEQVTLLGVEKATLVAWSAGDLGCGLDGQPLMRLSHVFGIYAALHELLPVPADADAWIKRPNSAPLLGGNTALDRMLGGCDDLCDVRRYLESQLNRG